MGGRILHKNEQAGAFKFSSEESKSALSDIRRRSFTYFVYT